MRSPPEDEPPDPQQLRLDRMLESEVSRSLAASSHCRPGVMQSNSSLYDGAGHCGLLVVMHFTGELTTSYVYQHESIVRSFHVPCK